MHKCRALSYGFVRVWCVVIKMAKDSQIDPKDVRKKKSKGGHTFAESALDGESRNAKKQSADRSKAGDDKKRGK